MTAKAISPAREKRRAIVRIFQKIQHAVPGVVLVQHGLTAFREGAHGWHLGLAVAEIVTAGAVFVSLFLAARKLAGDIRAGRTPHLHFGIDWTDIFLGLMLFTEVAAKYPAHHKIWSPSFLLGVVMIVLGVFGGRIAQWKAEQRARN
ncbi:MAG: hypothetical protein EPO35_05790 [Acidobacteria bacterium]|nr:MAG: hypothetical protein EPO35_05790 [Acidobacteriota bacterium]